LEKYFLNLLVNFNIINIKNMRILFAAGGTGGHIFPVIAVKENLEKDYKTINPQDKLESFLIGGKIINKKEIQEAGIIQKEIFTDNRKIMVILKSPITLLQSLFWVWYIMPDVIFSKGGPGALFVCLAGWLYRIPIIIHESDSIAGFTNKISSIFANKVAISFPQTKNYFPEQKTFISGNPIREIIIQGSKEEGKKFFNISGNRKVVLIIGGSQGSQQINQLIIDALYKYAKTYELIHICGKTNYKNLSITTTGILKEDLAQYYHLYPFLSAKEMSLAYAVAGIIIARAGAGTIFEIASWGKPSIIIPLSIASQKHQLKNAQIFKEVGACILLEGENLSPNFLFERVNQILENKKLEQRMVEGAKNFAGIQASKIINKEIFQLAL